VKNVFFLIHAIELRLVQTRDMSLLRGILTQFETEICVLIITKRILQQKGVCLKGEKNES